MKQCPTCGVAAGDEDAYCENDGTPLGARAMGESAHPWALTCPGCGAIDANGVDARDGYCSSCGFRLAPRSRGGVSTIPPAARKGETVGAYVVLAPRAPDDARARPAGAPPTDAREVIVALGEKAGLAREAGAIRALGDDPRVPRVIELGEDPVHGSFLTLGPPPLISEQVAGAEAPTLLAAAHSMSLERVVDTLRSIVALAAAFERAGVDWEPHDEDFYVGTNGAIAVVRVRSASPRKAEPLLDARGFLRPLAPLFLPDPLVRGPTALVRLFGIATQLNPLGTPSGIPIPLRRVRAELDGIEAPGRKLEQPADLATICDAGLARDHNQDAVASGTGSSAGEPWAILVVCDGVSSSPRSDAAATIAAKTALHALVRFAESGDIDHEAAMSAMANAIHAAHVAVCTDLRIPDGDPSSAPGTTIVGALVHRRRVVTGWVGDSRAYWVTPRGSELLTHDHSWVNEVVDSGEMSAADATESPLAHALTKCLGPLEAGDEHTRIDPAVRTRELVGPGHLVLCSDGLWNYFPDPTDIAKLVRSAPAGASAAEIARLLVNHALVCGGRDNVSVAVYAHS